MPGWLLWLLLAIPAAIGANALHAAPLVVFVLSAVAIIPLAGIISDATERLAEHTNQRLGGLLNATFGNAAELIVGITALLAGLPDVVRASISGSIIGNALLVLGMAMFLGGWRFGDQRFNARSAGQYATMLALAVVGLAIPSLVSAFGGSGNGSLGQPLVPRSREYALSFIIALVLLLTYIAYIAFTIFGLHARGADEFIAAGQETSRSLPPGPPREEEDVAAASARRDDGRQAGDEEGKLREKRTTRSLLDVKRYLTWYETVPLMAAVVLGVATALTAVVSEILVGAIEPVSHEIGLSTFFVGLIIIPIVGNAAEHTSAITSALHNHMETTMAITAGSSIQVALLVAPVLVLVSPLTGTRLDLNFTALELVIFALVAGLFALVSLDGESTWLEGLQLFAFYVIVAAAAFFVPSVTP